MKKLHRAALVRAYRTFAQGLAGASTATAFTAVLASVTSPQGGTAQAVTLAALATVGASLIAAFTSFWMGVYKGLPEVPDA